MRNSLAAFAVAIAIGGILPRLTHDYWPYVVAGGGFGLLGLAYLACGLLRQRALETLLPGGDSVRLASRLTVAITGYAVVLGVYTTVVVLVLA